MKNLKARAALIRTVIIALLLIPTTLLSQPLIFTADTGNNRLQAFDAEGNYLSQWGKYGKTDGQFNSPSGLAAGVDLYVADTGNNRIQKFKIDGTWLSTWGSTVSSQETGKFSSPNSIAVNMENCSEFVYVADTGNNRIQKFDAEGNWIAAWGGPAASSVPGKFNNPQGVSVDPSGLYIYVADTGSNRIQKLDRQGNSILFFGGYGTADGKFKYPRDVAVDSQGRVYVADNMNYRIQRFSSTGVFEIKWGTKGEGDGQLWDHYGISVDGQDNIYVADAGNNRVQVFTSDGIWVKTIGSVAQGIDEAEFYYPMGVDVYYEKPINPECVPTAEDTATAVDTSTETYTETFTETPTDTATETYTETFTETPTDTATETYTETFTETPTDTAIDTYTETFTETPTYTATETFTQTPADTATETFTEIPTAVIPIETPTVVMEFTPVPEKTGTAPVEDPISLSPVATAIVETPAVTNTPVEAQCALCYSVELRGRVKKTCDVPVVEEKNKGYKKEECGNREKVTVLEAPAGGYVYVFKAGGLKISVYDAQGCFTEAVRDMQNERNGRSARHFTAWYVKHLLKKNIPGIIPAEYYIALLFPSSGYMRLNVKDDPRGYEEMSAMNTYNYPNPSSGQTAIRFSLPASRAVDIMISDVSGRLVWQKHMQAYETIPGVNYLMWEGVDDRGREASNGTYIMRVMSGDKVVVKKIAIAR